ncbi:MAG TPA: hypothetical protein DDY37_05425, partial [Legionella sp.]|nr:hypothetical protein [Legionella sp.]
GKLRTEVLRVYFREKDAAYREQELGLLLKQTVPVPQVYFIGDQDDYRFAITEFLSGIPLRDLLLSDKPCDLSTIMHEAGAMLAKIQDYQFPTAGFFDKDLNIGQATSQDTCIEFAHQCIKSPMVLKYLPQTTILNIGLSLEKYKSLLPDESETHLVHADYDPANILVNLVDGRWKITGILDWEFAFSGSILWDVANMLRYAHHMPATYEESFLHGLQETVTLPIHWCKMVHLLNLLSLLDCLGRCNPEDQPNQCADICGLIDHILKKLVL